MQRVKNVKIFDGFAPEKKDVVTKASFIVEEKQLDAVVEGYKSRKEAMPKQLRKAIEAEKAAARNREKDGAEGEEEEDMIDLSFFLDDLDLDEDKEARVERLGEQIYKEAVKTEKQQFETDGLYNMIGGGKNKFIAALLQLFMPIVPLKNFFVADRHRELGEMAPDVKKRMMADIFADIYQEVFKP